MSSRIVKKRNWSFLMYPDSVPSDWMEFLQKTGLQCAISPLHDKDIDPTGLPKKPHYHVILCYSGPTSFNVVKSITDTLNSPIPIPLEQVKGMYRYFTHKDNPDKFQYDEKDIFTINGFNIFDYSDMTSSEIDKVKSSLQSLIISENIFEYCDFMDFLLFNQMTIEYHIASTNTYFFEKYISSRRNKEKQYKK